MSTVRNEKTVLIVDSVFVKLSKLFKESGNVDDHSISKDIDALLVQDTAWQEMESILVAISDNSVTSVSTTIESCADIIFFGKNVDKLALAFVSPLRAENDCKARLETSLANV